MEMFVKFKHFASLSIFAFLTLITLLMYSYRNETGKYVPKPSSSYAVLPNITHENNIVVLPLQTPKAKDSEFTPSSTGSSTLLNSTEEDNDYVLLRKLVEEINEKQLILNEAKFGPVKYKDNILLIQVHNRTNYFKLLIDSLRNVRGINETLLIFSQDIFNNETNEIVQSIDFAKVMQIFYPNSSQLYPNTFPGDDPNDCPRDIKKEDAIKIKCNNALYPDSFDHYRESQYAQMKHHWFWKLNFVFDSLRVTKNFSGFVTIIEDDYYLLPDAIHVLELMKREANRRPNIGLISLGNREYNYQFSEKLNVIEILEDVHFHSITMNKEFWNKLKLCATRFCKRDEYHWDWSFYHITTQCLNPPPLTLEMASSRVFHIGDCGMHRTKDNCFETFERMSALLNDSRHLLFPKKCKVVEGNAFIRTDGVGPWGGFSDPRDHSLCLSFVKQ